MQIYYKNIKTIKAIKTWLRQILLAELLFYSSKNLEWAWHTGY